MKLSKLLSSKRISSFFTRHGLLSALLLSSGFRLGGLGIECLWYDEAFTSLISDLPFDRALMAIAGDVHPPLYYLMSWIMAHMAGNSELTMRLPAALFGILSCYQLYLFVMAISSDKNLAIWSTFVMAVLPAQLYYSQEARGYTLLTWLVLFAMTSIVQRKWLRSTCALALLMFTHNLAVFYVAVLGVWMLLRGRGAVVRYLPVGMSYLAWLPVAFNQFGAVGGGFWIVDHGIGQLAYQSLFTTLGFRLPTWMQMHAALVVAALTLVSVWQARRERYLAPVLAVAFIPPILMYTVSTALLPVFLERALLPSGVMLMLMWVAMIRYSAHKNAVAILTVAVPVLVVAIVSFVAVDRDDFQSFAQDIESRVEDGDAIYHTSIPSVIFLSRYMSMEHNYIMPAVGDLNQSLTDGTKAAMGLKQLEVPVSDLHKMGYKRLWLLRTITPSSNQDRLDDVDTILDRYTVINVERVVDSSLEKFDVILLDLSLPNFEAIRWPHPAMYLR